MTAEIKNALKIVTSHFLFRSRLNINELFRSMFSDIHIAKLFKLSKAKCGYLANLGNAPYFKKVLRKEIFNTSVLSFLFDECMNHILMEC